MLGLGGMAALPPSVSQDPGKYLCFLVTRVNERNTIDLHSLEQNKRNLELFFTSNTRGRYFLSLTGKIFLELVW